jgi:hypothetical protein
MNSELVRYAKALFGLVIFILAILAIRTSGLMEAAVAPKVADGNVSAVDATWFLTVAESVVSFLFTWAVIVFVRVGEGGIAFFKALFGFKSSAPSVSAVSAKASEPPANDVDSMMRGFYSELADVHKQSVAKADSDFKAKVAAAIKLAKENVSK